MALQLSVNVYQLGNSTSGFPKRMTFPTQGFSSIATSQLIGTVSCYGIITYDGVPAIVVETPAQIATESNA